MRGKIGSMVLLMVPLLLHGAARADDPPIEQRSDGGQQQAPADDDDEIRLHRAVESRERQAWSAFFKRACLTLRQERSLRVVATKACERVKTNNAPQREQLVGTVRIQISDSLKKVFSRQQYALYKVIVFNPFSLVWITLEGSLDLMMEEARCAPGKSIRPAHSPSLQDRRGGGAGP